MGLLSKKKEEVETETIKAPEPKVDIVLEPAPKQKVEVNPEWDEVLFHLKVKKGTGKIGRMTQQFDIDEDVEVVKQMSVKTGDNRLGEIADKQIGLDYAEEKYY